MKATDFRTIAELDHIPIIRRDTEEFLARFISKNKSKRILEYGTAIGYSALRFSEMKGIKEIVSVEKDEYAFEIAKKNISLFETSKDIKLYKGDALKITNKLIEETGGSFDLIFIDGGKSHYLELIKEAMKLCEIGGYILSDDIWQRGLTKMNPLDVKRKHRTSMRNMQGYIEYLKTSPCFETEILDIGDGLAVSKYIKQNG